MPRTLLEWLTGRFPTASRQTLKRLVSAGRVRVNGEAARRLAQPLTEDDRVTVDERPSASPRHARAGARGLEVIYEDADILVVNKPPGLLTSTVQRELRPTLLARVREYVASRDPRARVGLIHRLDRDASGLLVFSKNDAAFRSLKTQFFHHDVQRVYTAVVRGVPKPTAGRVESYLVERADGSVHSTVQHGKGQHAVTLYETMRVAEGRRTSLLKVTLHTGRKHQIRVHLSEKGTPIVGDRVYGDAKAEGRLLLAAAKLALMHPRTGKRMTFEVSPLGEFALEGGAPAPAGDAPPYPAAAASAASRDAADAARAASRARRIRKQK